MLPAIRQAGVEAPTPSNGLDRLAADDKAPTGMHPSLRGALFEASARPASPGGGGAGALAPSSPRTGGLSADPGAAALGPAAEALVANLRAALAEQAKVNSAMLQATQDALGSAATAGSRPGSASGRPRSASASSSHAGGGGLLQQLGAAAAAQQQQMSDPARLAWVKSLVKQHSGPQGVLAGALAGGDAADSRKGAMGGRPGPGALRPNRREDVMLLQQWLGGMVQQVAAAGSCAGTGSSETGAGGARPALEMADASLYVYGVAMEELRRQVSLDCKERGELLSLVADQMLGLAALRGALQQEQHVSAVQAVWAALLHENARLLADVATLEAGAGGADREARAHAAASSAAASGLATKLVAAQQAAAAVERRWAVADAALSGEVERRLEAEEKLATAQELLRRQEHEWLQHRSANQALQQEAAGLRQALEEARARAAVAEAAALAARSHTTGGHDEVAELQVALAKLRQQCESSEIVVVAQRQQLRELESQVSVLSTQHKEQLVQLSKVGQVTEAYEREVAQLRGSLESSTTTCGSLREQLTHTSAELADTQQRLAETQDLLRDAEARAVSNEELMRKEEAVLRAEERRLRVELADAQAALRIESAQRAELATEMQSLHEQTQIIARAMEMTGIEGVPRPNDKAWNTRGPLGAGQRVLGMVAQQVPSLFAAAEKAEREVTALNARIAAEREAVARLTSELTEARTSEARLLRDKEEAAMKLAMADAALRDQQADALRLRAEKSELEARVKQLAVAVSELTSQVKRLEPLPRQVEELTSELAEARAALELASQARDESGKHLLVAEEQVVFFKDEVARLLEEQAALQAAVKELRATTAHLEVVEAHATELEGQVDTLSGQLEAAADSHADTIKQLELAKFFLQGLDSPPGVPSSRTGSYAPGGPHSPTRARMAALRATMMGSHQRSDTGDGTSGGPLEDVLEDDDEGLDGFDSADLRLPSTSNKSRGGMEAGLSGPLRSAGGGRPASSRLGGGSPPRVRTGSASSARGGGGGGGVRPESALSRLNALRGVANGRGGLGSPAPPTPPPTRPDSAVSVGSEDSMLRAEVPEEVLKIMEAKGLSGKLAATNLKWAGIKINVMAWFSAKLRARLLEETERCAALEVEMARMQFRLLNEMREREEFIVNELLTTLQPAVERCLSDSHSQVVSVRSELPHLHRDMQALAANCAILAFSLQGYRDRQKVTLEGSCQTDQELPDDWASFLAGLPPLQPGAGLTLGALTDAIVRIYVRAASTIEVQPTWGAERRDTMFDAIMGHYTSAAAPDTFDASLIRHHDSPVARLLQSALAHARHTKVACFLYFCGMSPDMQHWPAAKWHFFLHVLHALRTLLSGSWRLTIKQWATPQGVQLPIPAVLDLVGNLFNAQSPDQLDANISKRLAAIVVPGAVGPCVDLDALLLLLMREHSAGNCPRYALLYPRRVTDGQLFNIFNAAGVNAPTGSLQAAAVQYIGATPRSPTAASSASRPQTPSSPVARLPPMASSPSRSAVSMPSMTHSASTRSVSSLAPPQATGLPAVDSQAGQGQMQHEGAVGSWFNGNQEGDGGGPGSARQALAAQGSSLPTLDSGGSSGGQGRAVSFHGPSGSLTVSYETGGSVRARADAARSLTALPSPSRVIRQ